MTAAGPASGLLGILLGALFGGLLSFFVLLAYNRVKTRSDNKEMRESMAKLLHSELKANADEIDSYIQEGIRERPSIVDGVYSGLLSSGNMRHLMDHQESLYHLYVSMRRNEPDVSDGIRSQMASLEQIFL